MINLQKIDITELKPRINVFGVGGGGGNAVNNMISSGLQGVEFVVANTDAQALAMSKAERVIQLGAAVTEGLGAGSHPEVGRAAAEECLEEILDHLSNSHMVFVTAGMGGGTGTGAAPVIARAAREKGLLTVGVVTKPFHFEGQRRMKTAQLGIEELQKSVDTLIVIPNQNLFRIANERTTFSDAFAMADQVLYSGVASVTDLMVREGLINLDFADVRSVMYDMGKAMMGTGEASDQGRSLAAAEAAISNPLLDETSMRGAKGLLISITGGKDMTLFEVDEAANRIREEVDPEANVIFGAIVDESLEGVIRVSVVATGIDRISEKVQNEDLSSMSTLSKKSSNKNSYLDQEIDDPSDSLNEILEELQKEISTPTNNFLHKHKIYDEFSPKELLNNINASEKKNILKNTSKPETSIDQIYSIKNNFDYKKNALKKFSLNNNFNIQSKKDLTQENLDSNLQKHFYKPKKFLKRILQGFIGYNNKRKKNNRLDPLFSQLKNLPIKKPSISQISITENNLDLHQNIEGKNTSLSREKIIDHKSNSLKDIDKLEIPAFLRRNIL